MAIRTPICDLFGIEVPIIQTGMGWVAGARLTAATSEAGGLGILAAATMTLPELEAQVAEVKERTRKPFGVNLRADQPDIDDRLALLIREGVKVASFARAPGPEGIRKLKDAGVLTMPTVGAVKHAKKVVKWGVDAIIAQGGEGGGHTGSVPTSLLLPEVCEAVDVPVLGAGGFRDGRGLVAAMAFGAAGIAMGTRFLLTRESTVPDAVKQQYLQVPVSGTVVTRAVDGYPQRVVRTDFVQGLEGASFLRKIWMAVQHGLALKDITNATLAGLWTEASAMKKNGRLTWPQVFMAANAPMLTKASLVDGRVDSGILPTGQVVGCIDELPTVADLIDRIMSEAEATLAGLPTSSTAREAM